MAQRYQTFPGSFRSDFKDGTSSVTSLISDSVNEIRGTSRRRKPEGWIPPTSYSMDYAFSRGLTGTYINEGNGPTISRIGQLGRLGNHTCMNVLPLPSNARNDATIKALSKLKDQSVNLGVAFAEVQATADLVGTTANRLARACQAVKRKDAKGAFRALGLAPNKRVARKIQRGGNVPDKWLELQYGWLPLMGDIAGSVKALSRSQRSTMMQTVTSQVRDQDSGAALDVSQLNAGWADYTYHRETGLFLRMDFFPGNDFTNAMSRAGMTNPFEVLWERVPFSFVADWFLPVGDFLGSLDATIGWEFAGGSISTFSRVQVNAKQSLNKARKSSFYGSYKRAVLERVSLSSPPIPMRPGLKNPFSLGHMANGLSLLASVFGSKR